MMVMWSFVLVQKWIGVGLLIILVSNGMSLGPWMANTEPSDIPRMPDLSIIITRGSTPSSFDGDYKFIWVDIGVNGPASDTQVF